MQEYMLTYVSSEGVNPITGESFPEGKPKYRSTHEVYELLKLGFEVEQRIDSLRVPLSLSTFTEKYANEINKEMNTKVNIVKNKRK